MPSLFLVFQVRKKEKLTITNVKKQKQKKGWFGFTFARVFPIRGENFSPKSAKFIIERGIADKNVFFVIT